MSKDRLPPHGYLTCLSEVDPFSFYSKILKKKKKKPAGRGGTGTVKPMPKVVSIILYAPFLASTYIAKVISHGIWKQYRFNFRRFNQTGVRVLKIQIIF